MDNDSYDGPLIFDEVIGIEIFNKSSDNFPSQLSGNLITSKQRWKSQASSIFHIYIYGNDENHMTKASNKAGRTPMARSLNIYRDDQGKDIDHRLYNSVLDSLLNCKSF